MSKVPSTNAWHKGAPKTNGGTTAPPAAEGPDSVARERLTFSLACLVGRTVQVETIDGTVYQGVMVGAKLDEKEFKGCSLRYVRRLSPTGDDEVKAQLNVLWSETVSVFAPDGGNFVQGVQQTAPGASAHAKAGLQTDAAIGGGARPGTERKLEAADSSWVNGKATKPGAAAGGASLSSLSSGKQRGPGSSGKWDQFEANKELFGVVSTYDENLYTTELDKDSLTAAERRRADKLARDIENKSSTNVHLREERGQVAQSDFNGNESEEALYSSVSRGDGNKQAYQPPHSRAKSPAGATDTAREENPSTHVSKDAAPQAASKEEATSEQSGPGAAAKGSGSWASLFKGKEGEEAEKTSAIETAAPSAPSTAAAAGSKPKAHAKAGKAEKASGHGKQQGKGSKNAKSAKNSKGTGTGKSMEVEGQPSAAPGPGDEKRQRETNALKKFSEDITTKIAARVGSPKSSVGKQPSKEKPLAGSSEQGVPEPQGTAAPSSSNAAAAAAAATASAPKTKFNAKAKEWKPNAAAKTFTPGGAAPQQVFAANAPYPVAVAPPGAGQVMMPPQQFYAQPGYAPYQVPPAMNPHLPYGAGMYPVQMAYPAQGIPHQQQQFQAQQMYPPQSQPQGMPQQQQQQQQQDQQQQQ
eukprot:CAMPEP_0184514972 /NCGR_PEP_ID=MMETSP0198_2-20121128/4249_1 /TAXON_ID=1112570 /ORGANISM="Thraustochytrium sp., Strain LLF1b" /LENGTH=638 /DNA_ID=CAMNT_0026905199 /DNA_START=489 /DNA_END=2405 /DNA_ORIENTATION=+